MSEIATPNIKGYTVSKLLGQGATARVYLATNAAGQEVALKVLLPEAERSGPEVANMFANEVRMTQQLVHDNLIRAYEGISYGVTPYLALEYFPENSLDFHLKKGEPMPLQRAATLLVGIADGLAHVHRSGAIHQDVKPQNVYLKGERAVLADFGASYMLGQGGKVAGSPHYMGPEIFRGEDATAASDVYSFAAMAYEMLTGRRPFEEHEDYNSLMQAQLNATPAPASVHNPNLPRELVKLLQKALFKDPAARPSLAELSNELRQHAKPREVAAAPAGPSLGRGGAVVPPKPAPIPDSEAAAPAQPETKEIERKKGFVLGVLFATALHAIKGMFGKR